MSCGNSDPPVVPGESARASDKYFRAKVFPSLSLATEDIPEHLSCSKTNYNLIMWNFCPTRPSGKNLWVGPEWVLV